MFKIELKQQPQLITKWQKPKIERYKLAKKCYLINKKINKYKNSKNNFFYSRYADFNVYPSSRRKLSVQQC